MKIKLLTLYLSALLSGSAFSQQSDSLLTYLSIAIKNNPTVQQRFSEYQAALEKVPQVGSLPDPQLEMGVFLRPMELVGGNQVADIKLMQMFPWFGVLKNAKDEMSLMAKANYEQFRDAKLQVCYETQRTWFDLYRLRRSIRIAQENIELLKTIERLTLVKFKASTTGGRSTVMGGSISSEPTTPDESAEMNSMGNASGKVPTSRATTSGVAAPMNAASAVTGLSEVYQIQIETGNLEDNLASLKNEEQVVLARFNSQLNRPSNAPVFVPELLPYEPLEARYLSASDSMLMQNPMLGMLHFEQQSLEARVNMQKKMGLPMVGLGINYSAVAKNPMSTSSMNGQDMIMPMLTVTLPIYRKKYTAQQTETSFLKAAREHNYQATINALRTEYFEALQLYNDAQRRMNLYENQRQLTKKTLDIRIKTYSSSASGLTDVLRLRQQLFDYELKQVEATTDFKKATVWIKRLTNSI